MHSCAPDNAATIPASPLLKANIDCFFACCSDGCANCVLHGSMLLSRSHCACQSHSESLNVKTNPSTFCSVQAELHRFNCNHSRIVSQIPQDCFDALHVHVTCSSKTRRSLTHRTVHVCSVDPQQFANQLSIHSLLRLWQFFLVVRTTFPAQIQSTSRGLSCGILQARPRHVRGRFQECIALMISPAFGRSISNVCS